MIVRHSLTLGVGAAAVLGLALVIAAGPAAARVAWAETGVVHTLPRQSATSPAANPRSGLQLTVDTRWAEGPGYRPVRVHLKAAAASVADRTVTIRFRAGLQAGQGEPSIEVEQQIDLPAGALVVDAVMAVPHYEPWRAISWDTWVDGRRAKELSAPRIRDPQIGGYQNRFNVPAVLAVGTPTSVVRTLGELTDQLSSGVGSPLRRGARGAPTASATGGPAPAKFVGVAGPDLPTRWIDYSCVDIVCLSSDELRRAAAEQPAAWQAIVAWTRAGGNLWIYAVGDRWDRLIEIERATGLPPRATDDPADLPARGWQLPSGREQPGRFWPAVNSPDRQSGRLLSASGPRSQRTATGRTLPRDTDRPGFAWRDLQLGRVVAIESDAPFPGSTLAGSGPASPTAATAQTRSNPVNLEWILGAVGADRFVWERRYGLSTCFPTSDFWHFLIPGVGLAPVTAFHVLITLFVLILGPLNYYLLYRRNRLHLLAVTVPLGAVIITSGLFAYALLADGLATRVRVRSLTVLDQRQGHVVRWARLSYYAGLTPSAGLTFPTDTVVLPLLPTEGNFYGGSSYQGLAGLSVEWDNVQRLTRGWLRARTPTQYVTVQSSTTGAALQIRASQTSIRVENRLGADLQLLVLADAQGQFHSATGVGRGATVALDRLVEAEAIGQIRKIIADAQLRLPPGMQTGNQRSTWNRRRNRFGIPHLRQAYARPERVMTSLTVVPASPDSGWRKKMYVAIASPPAGIDLGVADAREEASLHVIVGRW
jgi:hypothetical protein